MIETTAKEYCAFMISDPRKMKWFLLIHKKASMDMSKGIKRGGGRPSKQDFEMSKFEEKNILV